jgi:hypothetical protein
MAPVPQAKGVWAAGTTSFVANAPSGILANDVLIIPTESSDSNTTAGTPNTPSGWAKIFEETQSPGVTGVTTLSIFAKIAVGGETDVTVDGVLNHISGNMFVIRGADPSIQVGVGGGGTTSSPLFPSVSVLETDCLVLMVGGNTRDLVTSAQWSAWTNANLTGITEWEDNGTDTGNGGNIGVAYGTKATSGITGNSTATLGNASAWRVVHLVFKPPAAPVGVGPRPIIVPGPAVHRSSRW